MRILRIVFVVAACLSFLVNGLVGGVALRAYRSGFPPLEGAARFALEVPAEKRAAMIAGLREDSPRLAARRDALRVARGALFAILAADDPDPAAARAAMAEVRAATTAQQAALQEVMFRKLVAEPPEEG